MGGMTPTHTHKEHKAAGALLACLALLGASWLAGVAREAADMTRPAVTAIADTYNGGK